MLVQCQYTGVSAVLLIYFYWAKFQRTGSRSLPCKEPALWEPVPQESIGAYLLKHRSRQGQDQPVSSLFFEPFLQVRGHVQSLWCMSLSENCVLIDLYETYKFRNLQWRPVPITPPTHRSPPLHMMSDRYAQNMGRNAQEGQRYGAKPLSDSV
jgi:hypothetical protein